MESVVLCAVKDGVATVTVNRPKQLNALNRGVLLEIERIMDELEADKSVKVIIFTGSGDRAFVAGADIAYMLEMPDDEAIAWSELGHRVFGKIESSRCFVIAAVNGYALGGGCELAMSCDMRIASENAKMGVPEVTLGMYPAWGGTQRLPRLVGLGIAKEMMATAMKVPAQRAYEIGLVNKVVPQAELLPACEEVAATILKNSALAISLGKRAMNVGIEMDLDKGLEYEAMLYGILFPANDRKEGVTAFLEKRPPVFK